MSEAIISQPASAPTQPAAAPAGGAKPWYDGAPQDVAAFVQTKGWDNPMKVVDSYRNLAVSYTHLTLPTNREV